MLKLLWCGIVMVLLVSGCGWNGTPTREDDISPVTSITISADYTTIAKGTSVKLKATGHVSGLGTRDLTNMVKWKSNKVSALFNSTAFPSRVSGVAEDSDISITAIYTASNGDLESIPYKLTVSGAKILSIAITPDKPTVHNGLTQQFTATGTFDDGTTQDITLDADWDSITKTVATISTDESSRGLATAVASSGTSEITATFDGLPGNTVLTATDPVVISIAVTPANPSMLSLSSKQFTATATYSDQPPSKADITSQVSWDPTNKAIATMTGGVATALAPGSTSINASIVSNGVTVSGSTGIKVTGGTLSSIALTPAAPSLASGTKINISAKGTFSDNSVRDITGVVAWSSDDSTLASVDVPTVGANQATLSGLGTTARTTKITVTGKSASTVTATATVSVTTATLSSVAITADRTALSVDTGGQLTVTGTFSDGSTQDLTYRNGCTFDPGGAGVAKVGTSGLAAGRVIGVAAGDATISATCSGKTTPKVTVNVTAPANPTVSITGALNVAVGNQVAYTATVTYGDGSFKDITNEAVWSLDPADVNVAALVDSTNQPGNIVAVDRGTATLTATFGTKSASIKIIVP